MTVMDVAHFQVHRLQRIAPVSQVLRKAEQATPQYNAARLLEQPKTPGKTAQGIPLRTASSWNTNPCNIVFRLRKRR